MNKEKTNNFKTLFQINNSVYFSLLFFLGIMITVLYQFGFSNYYLGWLSFSIAAFSVAGNDAIQTIGTFIESKKKSRLVIKIILFCGLLVLVHLYGWNIDEGEIHFNRLNKFKEPKSFHLLQLLAPIFLVGITRLKAPISTTFLILGLFGGQNIDKMLTKSFLGYGIAFLSAFVFWGLHSFFKKNDYNESGQEDKNPIWEKLQWLSTSFLWIAWLLQDTANIAVYLPRKLSILEVSMALLIISAALSFILYTNGGAIQELVSEKSDIQSSKAATLVDLVYGIILIVFQQISKMPMSTTWVFLGLLAGREISIHLVTKKDKPYLDTFKNIGKDVLLASLGIAFSIAFYFLAVSIYWNERG